MRPLIIASGLGALFLSACATTYDPVEVCSANWVKPRAERAVNYIEKDAQSVLKALRKHSDSYARGKTPGPLQALALTLAVKNLEKEIKNGQGIKDLRILRDTCNDPEIISDALTEFMQDQGLPGGLINFIQGLDAYQSLITDESGSNR